MIDSGILFRGGGENSPAIKPEAVAPTAGTPSQLSPPPTFYGDRLE